MNGPTYVAVDHRFHVEVPDGEPRRIVEAGLIDLRRDDPSDAPAHAGSGGTARYWIRPNDTGWYAIGRDEVTLRPNTDVSGAFGTLLWDINQQAARSAGDRLVVHAAALAGTGVGVLLPGRSGAGKSSLAAALVRGGMDYLSDELAVVDPTTWQLHAYPKPITLESGGAAHFADLLPEGPVLIEEHLASSRLRAGSVVATAEVTHLLFPRFAANGPTELRDIGAADALGRLAGNMMRPRDGQALPELAQLVERSRCCVLDYADLDAARDLALQMFEGDR